MSTRKGVREGKRIVTFLRRFLQVKKQKKGSRHDAPKRVGQEGRERWGQGEWLIWRRTGGEIKKKTNSPLRLEG